MKKKMKSYFCSWFIPFNPEENSTRAGNFVWSSKNREIKLIQELISFIEKEIPGAILLSVNEIS